MSIRHLVLMQFHEGTEPAAIQALADGLRALPDQIPAIADYKVGPDIGLADDNWDFAVSADFESVDDFHTYRSHPDHVAVIRELIQPHVAKRLAVQFDT
ncbi:MAG: Dabb family protein [Aquihabitans sp.]